MDKDKEDFLKDYIKACMKHRMVFNTAFQTQRASDEVIASHLMHIIRNEQTSSERN